MRTTKVQTSQLIAVVAVSGVLSDSGYCLFGRHCYHCISSSNSEGPGERAQNEPSRLDLHCFQEYVRMYLAGRRLSVVNVAVQFTAS